MQLGPRQAGSGEEKTQDQKADAPAEEIPIIEESEDIDVKDIPF